VEERESLDVALEFFPVEVVFLEREVEAEGAEEDEERRSALGRLCEDRVLEDLGVERRRPLEPDLGDFGAPPLLLWLLGADVPGMAEGEDRSDRDRCRDGARNE